jgi:hypothetical protein
MEEGRMSTLAKDPRFPALVRNDSGGLEVRYFATAAEAMAVSHEREVASGTGGDTQALERGVRPRMIDHRTFAKRIGAPSQLVKAVFRRGGLPGAIEHSPRLLLVPAGLVDQALTYGLRGLERRAKAGVVS